MLSRKTEQIASFIIFFLEKYLFLNSVFHFNLNEYCSFREI